ERGGGQCGRVGEGGGRRQVDHVEEVGGVGVAERHRPQVPLGLDQAEDRGVVVGDVGDVVAPGEGGHDHARDAEAVAVVAPGHVGRHLDVGWDVVGGDGGGRGDVVVVAPVLVVALDEEGLVPRPALQGGGDDAGGERFAQLDVL